MGELGSRIRTGCRMIRFCRLVPLVLVLLTGSASCALLRREPCPDEIARPTGKSEPLSSAERRALLACGVSLPGFSSAYAGTGSIGHAFPAAAPPAPASRR